MPTPPVIGFAAYSGTGKTTLLEKVIPVLSKKGLNIGLIKASHHRIDLDKPGKDSYRLRQAGASQLLLSTPDHSICFTRQKSAEKEPELEEQLRLMNHDEIDLIIVEGFRDAAIPKIELHRQAVDKPFLFKSDTNIIAIATDQLVSEAPAKLIQLDINMPEAVADFIIHFIRD
ncbi:molybdopterin-guanine dinucleotide biosynthesis protein B [Endozoicomonas sp. Mp262]|uniref:molybdopterin-guanine dinucleotide biosynthesis protein B n=1 Tax=Endozoicomonas sp. Mp262 TaxID=2919499 RepID=UPI0021D95F86